MPTDNRFSHETMEQIKIKVTLDGDLAATLLNLIANAHEHNYIEELIFCDHTEPKLVEFADFINYKLDIENRQEN